MTFSTLTSLVLLSCAASPPRIDLDLIAQRKKTEALVRQLADDSFDVRQNAATELLKRGRMAEDVLRKAVTDNDPEIGQRSKVILSQIQTQRRKSAIKAFLADGSGQVKATLPGWDAFAAQGGKDKIAREFYANVYQQSADFLESAQQDTDLAQREVQQRIRNLRPRVVTPGRDNTLLFDLSALLVVCYMLDSKPDVAFCNHLHNGLLTLSERAVASSKLRGKPPLRKLVAGFLKNQTGPVSPARSLEVATALGLPESVDWALSIAGNPKMSGNVRGYALVLLGKLGDKSLIPRLERLLEDKTPVGKRKFRNTTLQAEVGDLALAACIQLMGEGAGEKLLSYGYPYLTVIPDLKLLPAPECLGFATKEQRNAAMKKWRSTGKK